MPALRRHALLSAAGNVSLLLLSILLFCLLLELAARLLTLWFPPVMVLDAKLGWVHRPDVLRTYRTEGVSAVCRTNALGLRGSLPANSRGRRLLILGDSYADGLEVSDADLFSMRWAHLRPDLAIFNAGVGGYGTVQELGLYERLKARIRPDLLVLMVSWNDVDENLLPFYATIGPRPYVDGQGNLQPVDWNLFRPFLLPLPGGIWLLRHSIASYVAQNRYLGVWAVRRNASLNDRYTHQVSEDRKWSILEDLVGRLAGQAGLVIVGIPSREAVRGREHTFGEHLAQVARRLGAQWIDLQPVLREEDYYAHDIHWNASGHHRVGEYLAKAIDAGPASPGEKL